MRDPLQSIKAFNQDRDTGLKFKAMTLSPFRFFRGTCSLFYEDYSRSAQIRDPTHSWICGDLHLANFGTFRGDNRQVYFDMNDFDEAVKAPVTWEITRLLTSIHVAIHTMGLPAREGDRVALQCLQEYVEVLASGKSLVSEAGTAQGVLKALFRQVSKRTRKELILERTIPGSKPLRIRCDGVHAIPLAPHSRKDLTLRVGSWFSKQEPTLKSCRILDAARRIAGTGSLGIERYILLVTLPEKEGKLRLLDLKEARASSLDPWLRTSQTHWANEATRIVTIQKRVQHVSPALLRALELDGKTFVLRELQPTEDKMDLEKCDGKVKKLELVLNTMAQLAASGQIRSGGQQGASITDTLKAFALEKSWQPEILAYAKSYSRQVIRDFAKFIIAYRKGAFRKK
ncbi:MAG TPA: DUF2252 family protein [Chitinophagaceae bacterium]|nr:DUF2252 family protein [Chitinophagaceae bacterium]